MNINRNRCPDCCHEDSTDGSNERHGMDRRNFIKAAGVAAITAGVMPPLVAAADKPQKKTSAESLVKVLFDKLSKDQKQKICYDWDHIDKERGLLRTRVSNNWHINQYKIKSDFYTAEQQDLIRKIFEGIFHPDWHKRIDKQIKDDAGGFGKRQNIAIFGTPGKGKFEFVMTGRHMTIRCDGNSADHVAFGGPIFYGHAAQGFNEKPDHPGNVFWPQAVAANKLFEILDGKQRHLAMVGRSPREEASGFRAKGERRPGIPFSELTADQKEHVQKVLNKLLEPYRQSDRDEALACLKSQGGLDHCNLAFYRDSDIGNDGVWDNWRLEGPAFVWYFRGKPHVHVWVNVANDPSVKLNS